MVFGKKKLTALIDILLPVAKSNKKHDGFLRPAAVLLSNNCDRRTSCYVDISTKKTLARSISLLRKYIKEDAVEAVVLISEGWITSERMTGTKALPAKDAIAVIAMSPSTSYGIYVPVKCDKKSAITFGNSVEMTQITSPFINMLWRKKS